MTTDNDLILSALSLDAPVTRAELEEATGLEAKTLSNRLFALHTKGLIAKNPEGPGWLLSGESAKSPSNIPKIIPAREPAGEAPAPKKPGPKPKAAKAPRSLPPPRIIRASRQRPRLRVRDRGVGRDPVQDHGGPEGRRAGRDRVRRCHGAVPADERG